MLALWQGLGGLLATGAGAAGALLALARGVALDVACLRGGAIALGLLVLTRLGSVLLARILDSHPKEKPAMDRITRAKSDPTGTRSKRVKGNG